jgi:hypothetical protein
MEGAFEDGIKKNARIEDPNKVDNILMNPVLVLIAFSATRGGPTFCRFYNFFAFCLQSTTNI